VGAIYTRPTHLAYLLACDVDYYFACLVACLLIIELLRLLKNTKMQTVFLVAAASSRPVYCTHIAQAVHHVVLASSYTWLELVEPQENRCMIRVLLFLWLYI